MLCLWRRRSNTVLLVSRVAVTPRSGLRRASELLQVGDGHVTGIVANDVGLSDEHYGYGYGYGYGYRKYSNYSRKNWTSSVPASRCAQFRRSNGWLGSSSPVVARIGTVSHVARSDFHRYCKESMEGITTSRRSALLRMAILSSALRKIGALGLQTIAIPLVYHALGQHQYALFLLVTGALATISLMQMSAGPGLTRIAKANIAGGREEEASIFSAALRLSLLGAVTGSGALLVIVYTVQPARLFGEAFGGDRPEILAAMKVCAAVLAATIVLGVVDSAFAGYQEQVITNLFSFCGNIASTALLVIVSSHHPSIMRVILILYGLMACSRIAVLSLIVRRPICSTSYSTTRFLAHTRFYFTLGSPSGLCRPRAPSSCLAESM